MARIVKDTETFVRQKHLRISPQTYPRKEFRLDFDSTITLDLNSAPSRYHSICRLDFNVEKWGVDDFDLLTSFWLDTDLT